MPVAFAAIPSLISTFSPNRTPPNRKPQPARLDGALLCALLCTVLSTGCVTKKDDPTVMIAYLAEPQEHHWLFQPDYNDDATALVELLAATETVPPTAPLVSAALTHLGVRYRWGGTDPKRGFDCSGLVVYAAQQSLGLRLPRTAASQARTGTAVKRAELQAGDLVFFNTRGQRHSHVGIYVGDDKFVHAPRTGAVVRVENLRSSYWQQRYNGARRLVEPQRAVS